MNALADNPDIAETVEEAIASRRSIRRFLPTPVSRETVTELLALASRAPSGSNIQPWRVTVIGGETKAALSAAILEAHDGDEKPDREYNYYPLEFPEPYLSRRRKIGWDLYGLLGIEKGDKDKMHAQQGRNFEFFDAPVGLFFTIDRRLEIGSWLDFGMFLENIMIAARGKGLHTCPGPPSPTPTGSSANGSAYRRTKSSSAACRSSLRITKRPKTAW